METQQNQAPADSANSNEKPGSNQKEQDAPHVPTVTPDNENGLPGPPAEEDTSNKGKGPAGENL